MKNNLYKKIPNVTRQVIWLTPGLNVKRWLVLLFLGILLIAIGSAILLNLHPVHFSIEILRTMAGYTTSEINGTLAIIVGALLFFYGWKSANNSIFEAVMPQSSERVLESLYRKHKLSRGAKIVAIGGGTGLSAILRGLKKLTNNLTAVVTVGDDGGSSGRLREEMGVLPPGDIRNCIAALADEEKLVTELFQYRFNNGEGLEGHSFGNLFLTALCSITGDMVSAVKESSKVLAIRGRVLPSTLDDMRLAVEMEDGSIIHGESNIPKAKGTIKRVFAEPANLKALDEVIEAINDADIIILGPGSLYTSVIPNLLIPEITQAIKESKAKKAYICNAMTQEGETDNFTASDHLKAIINHTNCPTIIDTIFLNDKLSEKMITKYSKEGSEKVKNDFEALKALNVNVICKRLIQDSNEGLVRHSPQRIARLLQQWYKTGLVDVQQEFDKNYVEIQNEILDTTKETIKIG